MSNAALNWAFEQQIVVDPLARLLLIALANRLNAKTGRLDPNIDQLCADTGMSRRTVINKMQELVEAGLVERKRQGQSSNAYTLPKCMACTSADAPDVHLTSSDVHLTSSDVQMASPYIDKPEEPEEPEVERERAPDLFESEPPKKAKAKPQSSKRDQLLLPLLRVVSPDRAEAVVDHRIVIKKPLTPYAAKLLARKFERAPAECGLTPDEAVDEMIAHGWQGFESKYINNDRDRDRQRQGEREPRNIFEASAIARRKGRLGQ